MNAGGMALSVVAWEDPGVDWSSFDAVLIGTAWNYQDHLEAFLETLQRIEAAAPLYNPFAMVAWNCRKTYLRDLERAGARVIPTVWIDTPQPLGVRAAFEALRTDDLVLKRQVGAGGEGQHRLRAGGPIPALDRPMMAQPFLPAIETEGEFSFVFIDGAFSHALLKRARAGEYRIQTAYGGTEAPVDPPPRDIRAAAAVLASLEGEPPLYARVDMVRGADGALALMELELIEPFLYPIQGPEVGDRLAAALRARIAAA